MGNGAPRFSRLRLPTGIWF